MSNQSSAAAALHEIIANLEVREKPTDTMGHVTSPVPVRIQRTLGSSTGITYQGFGRDNGPSALYARGVTDSNNNKRLVFYCVGPEKQVEQTRTFLGVVGLMVDQDGIISTAHGFKGMGPEELEAHIGRRLGSWAIDAVRSYSQRSFEDEPVDLNPDTLRLILAVVDDRDNREAYQVLAPDLSGVIVAQA